MNLKHIQGRIVFLFGVALLCAVILKPPPGLAEETSSSALPINPAQEQQFSDSKACAACHPRQYDAWIGSMHSFAQVSPANELVNDFLLRETGKTVGPFCIQCHTPIGTVAGEPYETPNSQRSQAALSGISCVVCHSIEKIHGSSQAFFGLKPSMLFWGPFGSGTANDPLPVQNGFHQTEQKALYKSSQLCQNCHELIVPNGFRLQETYREWEDSPWAKEGVECQTCHMSSVPGRPAERPLGEAAELGGLDIPLRPLSDHSFVGVDYHWNDEYPLRGKDGRPPDARGKKRNAKIQEENRQKRRQLMHHAARVFVTPPSSLSSKKSSPLGVRIENQETGHHFPSGFPWRQAWLEVTLTNAEGEVLFRSGDLDSQGDMRNRFSREVNEKKLPLDRHLVNLSTQVTIRGFRGNDIEVMFPLAEEDAPSPTIFPAGSPQSVYNGAEAARMVRRGIPARQSRSFSYPLPPFKGKTTGPVTYTVRLLYRNLPPYYFDYLSQHYPTYASQLAEMKKKLEIYEVDMATGTIPLQEGSSPR